MYLLINIIFYSHRRKAKLCCLEATETSGYLLGKATFFRLWMEHSGSEEWKRITSIYLNIVLLIQRLSARCDVPLSFIN